VTTEPTSEPVPQKPATTTFGPFKPKVREPDTSHDTALSNIRHSLRTPLNQIIGYSEMLQEEVADLGLEEFTPDLQKMHTGGVRLLALINESLAATRIEAGKLDLGFLQRECRTMLDLIIGYCELCQEDASSDKGQRFVADLEKIHTAADTLLRLLSDAEFLKPLTTRAPAQKFQVIELRTELSPAGLLRTTAQAPAAGHQAMFGTILVVDDNENNRDMLSRRLERQGHKILQAENGRKAVELLEKTKADVVLLDILMPEMDGLQTLDALKANGALRHTPVIMLSALDELDRVVRCIEVGADDYLTKPFNPVLLNARINACLEKKRLRDQEQAYLEQLSAEREKSERLLLNILPKTVADRLKQGETNIADHFAESTVLFADLVNFTQRASNMPANDLVRSLNEIFSKFDWLAELHHLEKIKTMGDAYMVVGGVPTARGDHAEAVAEMAMDMQKVVAWLSAGDGNRFDIRIGISSGPVVGGIIGSKKFIYDLWGDTVNTASRMESLGQPGSIQVAEPTYQLLKDRYELERRGEIDVKGKGRMTTYFLRGRKQASDLALIAARSH
jgi:class 3 adenylate cyclase